MSILAQFVKNRMRHTRIKVAQAAGQTTITSDALNMASDGGYRNVAFFIPFGTITSGGVQSVKVQQSSDDGSSDAYSDLEGTSVTVADTDDNKVVIIDIVRPAKDYLKVVISRATQDSVVDGIFALQYDGNAVPSTHDSTTTVTPEGHVSPAEGTA